MRLLTRVLRKRFILVPVVSFVSLASPVFCSAAVPVPHWLMMTQSAPTDFHAGDSRDFYEIVAANDGGADTSGALTVTDVLPKGVTVNFAIGRAETGHNTVSAEPFGCNETSQEEVVTVTCTTTESVPTGRALSVNINLTVPENETASSLTNTATVVGGGAATAQVKSVTPITNWWTPVPFGVSLVSEMTEVGGLDTQAGSHPLAFTALLAFNVASVNPNESCDENQTPSCAELNAEAKDIEVALPAGVYGNPTAVPYCTHAQFEIADNHSCPASSQVGGMYLEFYGAGTGAQYAPVYNIEPPAGQPAELGFTVGGKAHIPMFFHVRSNGDYGLTSELADINQFDPVRTAVLSLWGNPSDEIHNPQRESSIGECTHSGGCPSGIESPKPFLSLPTNCSAGETKIEVTGDSWQEPVLGHLTEASFPAMTGCEALTFHPAIDVTSSTPQAGAPAGYNVDLQVPQNEGLEELATPELRNAEVALPEGTMVSPSVANGLAVCSESQFGLKSTDRGHCPSASRIGAVEITTPLLHDKVKGAMYAGEPDCSPCSPGDAETGRLVRVLLEAEADGVIIKQAGHTKIDQKTGRLTAVFTNAPQLPFSDLQVSVEGGANAPLANPANCGPAVASAQLTPWSSATPTSVSSEPITITGCMGKFAPSFQAGRTDSTQAGAFTGFSVALSRQDGEQTLGKVDVTMPPGMLGVLKNVEQCQEPQAKEGTCSTGALIGTSAVTVGPGSAPLTIDGGKVYLTGPYAGQPFGLAIVTPAKAGPFTLAGNTEKGTEVIRAAIAINPHTSAITVISDPVPQALDGIPLDIRNVKINVNRESFLFSPTNCDAMAVTGTLTSAGGATESVSNPLQATGCPSLPFKPTFTVSTQGKTSKKNGASLHVKVTSGPGQANIAKVKVNLPIQLPSRLSTLQKACVDAVFSANPGSCPAASVVGQATAVTPLLAKPLTGPAYLVSHAGAAFPDLEVVLEGEGITLILDGNTQIKKGITSSIFRAIPDAPIASFDLVLPEGPHSALAAFGNLCTSKLNMPTVITGQNGAVVRQTTKIAATGCPKVKAKKVTKRHKAKKGHKAKGSAKRGRSVS
jgi:hypothetical protein